MRILALADPHLALGTPDKKMDRFGPAWIDHASQLAENWRETVGEKDIVLMPGDISWAMRMAEAQPDLAHLDALPGVKVLGRGNHDYWWSTLGKVRKALPSTLHAVDRSAIELPGCIIAGTRLWDVPGLQLGRLWAGAAGPDSGEDAATSEDDRSSSPESSEDQRFYERELIRLRLALDSLERLARQDPRALRVAMVHFPPTDSFGTASHVTELMERFGIAHVVCGHLHGVDAAHHPDLFGTHNGVQYHLVAADYLGFRPKVIAES